MSLLNLEFHRVGVRTGKPPEFLLSDGMALDFNAASFIHMARKKEPVARTLALSTTIKNRLSFLRQSLPTWLASPLVSYIYILNWGSDDGNELHSYVNSLRSGKIVVEDVSGDITRHFIGSTSRNIASERCIAIFKPDWLFQIDSDIRIHQDFNRIELDDPERVYMSESTRMLADCVHDKRFAIENADEDRPKCGDFGSCLMHRDKVFRYGYYNENLIDNNLFDALYLQQYYAKEQWNINYFGKWMLEHIYHDNATRLANLKHKNFAESYLFNDSKTGLPNRRVSYQAKHGNIAVGSALWSAFGQRYAPHHFTE